MGVAFDGQDKSYPVVKEVGGTSSQATGLFFVKQVDPVLALLVTKNTLHFEASNGR